MKYSLVGLEFTSSFLTAILVFHTLCMQRSITMSHGTPSGSVNGKNLIPNVVSGKSFLIVRWRMSHRNTESQQSRKMCSIVSGFRQIMQLTPQGRKNPFCWSHGLTGSVPVCKQKKNDLVVAFTGIFFTRFNTSFSGPKLYRARYTGTGHIISTRSLYNRFRFAVCK